MFVLCNINCYKGEVDFFFMAEKYLKFDEIPECFYDKTLSPPEWEETLLSELKRVGYYEGRGDNCLPEVSESNDILDKIFEIPYHDPIEYAKNNREKLEKELEEKNRIEEERRNSPDRIYYDEEFRSFLYNKGVDIPTKEMGREFYLRERMNSSERKNLLDVIQGFSNYMVRNNDAPSYAVFGVGTSTYPDSYFSDLEKNILEAGFNMDSEIVEKAASVAEQGFHFEEFEDYVEGCFNYCVSIDGKMRPVSREEFYLNKSKEQKRYSKKKRVGDILENKGEDLDFAICLEELYGGTLGSSPHLYYREARNNEGEILSEKHFDILKRQFISYLKQSDYEYEEEVEMLSSAKYPYSLNGELVREKDILNNDNHVSTFRVKPKEGREMHFYLYNQMADMKVKHERIINKPFVQIERQVSSHVNLEFGSGKDLEAAIKNGEETGVFENPLLLKWKDKSGE